jgi:hypothetical protein
MIVSLPSRQEQHLSPILEADLLLHSMRCCNQIKLLVSPYWSELFKLVLILEVIHIYYFTPL